MPHTQKLKFNELDDKQLNEWRELLDRKQRHLSESPDWIMASAAAHQLLDSIDVYLYYDQAELSSVISVFSRASTVNGLKVITLHLATDIVSYHISPPDQDDMILLREILGDRDCCWDRFRASNIIPDLLNMNGMGFPYTTAETESSPYISISDDWETFFASKSSNFRNKVGRMERKLAKIGQTDIQWFETPEKCQSLLNDIMDIESECWKVSNSTHIQTGSDEYEYYRNLLPWLASSGQLLANVEYLDNEPISYSLGYIHTGKYGQLKTSFKEKYRQLMPGLVSNRHAIEECFKRKLSEFDFLGPDMPHKRQWTDNVRPHIELTIFSRTMRGRFLYLKSLIRKFIQK